MTYDTQATPGKARHGTATHLVDDAVAGGEEGEHVLHEVFLVVREPLPVLVVVRQVQLLRGPEACLGLLVHLPHL